MDGVNLLLWSKVIYKRYGKPIQNYRYRLYKSKNSLKKVKSRMTEKGKQNSLSSPRVFNHILESLVTERIQDLYRKHEKNLMEAFETPFAGLLGLINNQILTINERMIKEIIDSVPPIEGPPVDRDVDEFFESS